MNLMSTQAYGTIIWLKGRHRTNLLYQLTVDLTC